MCGYQGWFRAEGDGSGEGWAHYSEHGSLTAATIPPDFWPDVSEYDKTYPTALTNKDGSVARVFSSWDQSTTDLHFKWMKEYGIDGVFVQRFLGGLHNHGQGDNAMIYPLNQVPRQKGRFYWNLISGAIDAKAMMLYVAMFDEMDEGTAIFKCSNNPPAGVKLCDYEGMPTDYYLWLTGEAGKMLRGEIPFTRQIPDREPSQ